MPAISQTSTRLERFVGEVIRCSAKSAFKNGISPRAEYRLGLGSLKLAIDIELRRLASKGYASPEEGYRSLLDADEGCITMTKALKSIRLLRGMSHRGLRYQIRCGTILAIKGPTGSYLIPRWQFGLTGRLLSGFSESLAVLRSAEFGYTPLMAFAFFLRPMPMLGGETPLAHLRRHASREVVFAACEHVQQ